MSGLAAERFHVGEYIADELELLGWSVTYLADLTGEPEERWSAVIAGSAGLLVREAEALARIGWGSVQTWMEINRSYNVWKSQYR